MKGNEDMDNIEKLQEIIDESKNIVFFGGAGVSTESGIKDFRGDNGLYKEKYDYEPEYLLSTKCFFYEPKIFFHFYKSKMNCLDAKPNITHKYLTKLEKKGKLKAIITQNIDGLHQKAGSKNVLEIHGTIHRNHCIKCNKSYSADFIFNTKNIPKCSCGGVIKPDVILYGEMLPDDFSIAQDYIRKADTFLTVEPASSLVRIFSGQNLVIINKDNTPYDKYATLVIRENLVNVFSKLD